MQIMYICFIEMKSILIRHISRFILLSVYVSFFLVQSFTTTVNDLSVSSFYSYCHTSSNKDYQKVKKMSGSKTDSKQTNNRLNKRFQPEAFLSCSQAPLSQNVIHIQTYQSAKPIDHLLISSILAASLRGPPAMG